MSNKTNDQITELFLELADEAGLDPERDLIGTTQQWDYFRKLIRPYQDKFEELDLI